ncbi:RecA-family ATPase [Luteibacter sp. UNCMF331Sha3.1]|uniref:AAA family ATPase n=1 Tax=Luteibacter sp. UNCMF331Sha3.1 TaxID=1502760 RepID=UPI0008B52574|nr:AAA family ATPase [Luteibacter sp. UNCMF331Sha3.1]SEN09964.1 RecA-family ATPase [Luteibacter sp. UNCMF331Sha3.1]
MAASFDELPESMRAARRWLLWREEPSDSKSRKVPFYTTGVHRHGQLDTAVDTNSLATFDDAVAVLAAGGYTGLGFALGADGTGNYWQGIDFDDVPNRPALQLLAEDLPGYVEASPSGRGIHAIGYGKEFAPAGSNGSGIEAYSRGRFFTVTGEGAGLGEPTCLADHVELVLRPIHRAHASQPSVSVTRGEAVTPQQVAELRSALASIRADDRQVWIENGQRLRSLGDVGRELWISWSQTSDKWRPADARTWDTLDGSQTSFRAVFAAAQAAGWVNPMSSASAMPAIAANDDMPSLKEIDLSALLTASLSPPGFVIEPLIPRRVVTLLGGHGGLGKTMLALVICAHVAAGRGWGPFAIEQGRAVFVSLEDDAPIILFRLRAIIDEYSLPADEVRANLRIFDGTDIAPELMVPHGAGGVVTMRETPLLGVVSEAVQGADLTIIDNASESFGGNANDPMQVKAFLRRLKAIAMRNDAGLVLLAHVDKASAKNGAQGNSYLGTAAWHNSARSRLALVKDDNGPMELRHEKSNLAAKAQPILLQQARNGVLVPADGGGSRESAEALIAAADADAVYGVLVHAINAGLTVTAATAGPSTAWHVLASLPELGPQYRNHDGKRRVQAALVKLSRDGRIIRAEFKKPDRHTGTRWELPQRAADIAA